MTDTLCDSDNRYATVRVWSGGPLDDYDEILNEDPDEYKLEIVNEGTYHVPHEDHVVLADRIDHHGKYAFDLAADETVELHVETSDHYHDTIEGFERGNSIERGLLFREGHRLGSIQNRDLGLHQNAC
jgi:hypothetical protein